MITTSIAAATCRHTVPIVPPLLVVAMVEEKKKQVASVVLYYLYCHSVYRGTAYDIINKLFGCP